MNWDDLKYFLAVARCGVVSTAAKSLGVNHTTVSRRISALEEKLGSRLFERGPNGFRLSLAGEEVVELAEKMEAQASKLDRHFQGRDKSLTGVIRITAPQTLLLTLFADIIGDFAKLYPDIRVECHAGDEVVSLARREADIAFRVTDTPQDSLIGRRIGAMGYAVFAAPDYLTRMEGRPMSERGWIGWFTDRTAPTWVEEFMPGAPCVARTNEAMSKAAFAAQGMGYALLGCPMGAATPGVVQVSDPQTYPGFDLWMLTHQDMRSTARLRVFKDFAYNALKQKRKLIAGVPLESALLERAEA